MKIILKRLTKCVIVVLCVQLLNVSCSNESVGFENFKHSKWKIDSVAENSIINHELIQDTVTYIFNFGKDGVVNSQKISDNRTEDFPVGDWEMKDDKIFVYSKEDSIAISYRYDSERSTLILNGNFQDDPQKETTYYLTKYVEFD